MNPVFPDLSLQQLVTLQLLLKTCSVTRTAEALQQSQPAVSMALRRLREALDDPLLVRSGAGMVPTPKGQQLQSGLQSLLCDLQRLLDAQKPFDPVQASRAYSIATADCMQSFFLPRLGHVLTVHMPQIKLRMRPLNVEFDYELALAAGDLDLVIGNWPDPPAKLRRKVLFQDPMVCLARRDHPRLTSTSLDLQTYLSLGHVAPEPYMALHIPGPVDGAIAVLGFERMIKATIPDFNMAAQMVAETDLIFTCCRRFGAYYARMLDLQVVEAPPEFPPMQFYMLWHDRMQSDAAHIWFRDQIHGVALEFSAPL